MTYEYNRPKRDCIISYIIGIVAATKKNKHNSPATWDTINDHLESYNEPPITEQEKEIFNLIELMEQIQYMGIGGRRAERETKKAFDKSK